MVPIRSILVLLDSVQGLRENYRVNMMQRRFVHACACRLVTGRGERGWKEEGEGRERESEAVEWQKEGKGKGRKRGK